MCCSVALPLLGQSLLYLLSAETGGLFNQVQVLTMLPNIHVRWGEHQAGLWLQALQYVAREARRVAAKSLHDLVKEARRPA